jgi:hypothetical protein
MRGRFLLWIFRFFGDLRFLRFIGPTPFDHLFAEIDRLVASGKERRNAIYAEIVTFAT